MTLLQLAEASGISRSSLSRYEREGDVPRSALQHIADALNIPVSQLLVEPLESFEPPESEASRALYAQLNKTQQTLVYYMLCLDLARVKLRSAVVIIALLLAVLAYILLDRFVFPDALLFQR